MTEPQDPTELAGVAEAGTESVEAWSLADELEDYPATGSWEDPERRLTPRRITILAVAASVAAVAGAVVVGFSLLRVQHEKASPRWSWRQRPPPRWSSPPHPRRHRR